MVLKENIGIILIIQFTFRLMKNATYAENCLWDIYFYVSEIKGLRKYFLCSSIFYRS